MNNLLNNILSNELPEEGFQDEADFESFLVNRLRYRDCNICSAGTRKQTYYFNRRAQKLEAKYDIIAEYKKNTYALELKLINTDAGMPNLARFDILNDFQRVGCFKTKHKANGFAITLTNQKELWNKDISERTIWGSNFSVHEGRSLTRGGALDWNYEANPNNQNPEGALTQLRINWSPIKIFNTQTCHWQESAMKGFKYMLLQA